MYIPSGSSFWSAITGGIRAIAGAQRLLDITHSTDTSRIYGADATGDSLMIYSNGVDSYPRIKLDGNLGMYFWGNTSSIFRFYSASVETFNLSNNPYHFAMREATSSPSTKTDFGLLYTKSDNKLYFKDGDGTEHTVAFV